MPRLGPPDLAIYAVIVGVVAVAAYSLRENAPAPQAPQAAPPPPSRPAPGFDAVFRLDASAPGPDAGTAFSAGAGGVWLTARHVVEGCAQPAVIAGQGRGVAAQAVLSPDSDIAVLLTQGGAPPLPLADGSELATGARGYHPGYPMGLPGEAASRLLGRQTLAGTKRGEGGQPVLAWAETGRTKGLNGPMSGLSGAPVLNDAGQVVGVTIAQSPRRGLIYTTTTEAMTQALAAAGKTRPRDAAGQAIGVGDYYRAASDLRRDLRVVLVVCAEA